MTKSAIMVFFTITLVNLSSASGYKVEDMKSKSLGEKLLSLPIKNCDEECSKFWNKFGARFLQAFEASNYSLTSHAMRNWMKNETIPDNALTNDMYPPANASKDTLGITNVFAACIPGPENYAGLTTLNFEKQFHDPHFHYGCNDEEVLIRIVILGWGPQAYVGIHDHPIGGCLAKYVAGPGVIETHYSIVKNGQNQEFLPMSDSTKQYKCTEDKIHHSDGCSAKHERLAWIRKLKDYHMTKTNLTIMYQEGYDYMHSVFNPHGNATLTLHAYFGDYRISYWEEI